jgi:hypothetical protein
MPIVKIPKELSSVRRAEDSAGRLAHAAGELDNGLHRTVVVVALLEQEQVSKMIW